MQEKVSISNQNESSSNNEKSFSMAFNPITNIKTIREYEEEIKNLKEEVFELKTQLSHTGQNPNVSNVPKILYENSVKVEELDKENKILINTISSLKNQLLDLNNEKTVLMNRQEQMQFVNNEKKSLLEDENKRLLHKLTKSSKVEEQLRTIIINLENDVKMLRDQGTTSFTNEIAGYRNALDEIKRENRSLKEACNNLSVANNKLNEEMGNLANENLSLKNEIENARNQILNAHSSMCENDHQLRALDTKNLELKEKLDKALNDCSAMKNEISCIEDKNKILKETLKANEKGLENYAAGMKKFKEIISGKISNLAEKTKIVDLRVKEAFGKFSLTKENSQFLSKLLNTKEFIHLTGNNINDILTVVRATIQKIKKSQKDLTNQNAVLENENKDMKFFGKNKILMELQERITEAVGELNICRGYMEKKARENKELKNEISRIKADQNKINKQLANARKFYENVTAKYGPNCIKI